jgi:hypothetical protein
LEIDVSKMKENLIEEFEKEKQSFVDALKEQETVYK